MELKQFYLPIFPDFGMYVNTIVEVAFPLILAYLIGDIFNFKEKRKIKTSRYHHKNLIFYAIITFFLFTIVALTSVYFKYYILTIGSGSMTPTINKGDAVIIKKITKEKMDKTLKKGDILAFNHGNVIIIHRLVKIKKINGKKYYITKGDNNLTEVK